MEGKERKYYVPVNWEGTRDSYTIHYEKDENNKVPFPEDVVPFDYVKIVHKTDKAYLLQLEHGEAWIAKSQVHSFNGAKRVVYIPIWLACTVVIF